MDLTLHGPGEANHIRSATAAGILIGEVLYTRSIVISAERLNDRWGPGRAAEIDRQSLRGIFDFEPEIVLIGTGATQTFIAPVELLDFYQKSIGVEIMTTAAACRTFNVLVSEERRVCAALIPPGAG